MKYWYFLSLAFLQGCFSSSSLDRGYLIPASSEPAEISFSYAEKLIILEAEINGISGKFLFDNGFSMSAISPNFAKKASIKFTGSSNLNDANRNKLKTGQTTIDTLIIEGHKFVETGFYEIDTKKFFPCDDIDGVIGASIINKINWEIDFENKLIRISSKVFKNEGTKFKIDFSSNNSSLVNMQLNGIAAKYKIDFGWNGCLKGRKSVFYEVFKDKETEVRVGKMSLSATGLGSVDSTFSFYDDLKLKYKNKPLPNPEKFIIYNKLKYQGYVGLDYFRNYKLTVNSTSKEYILSPNSEEKKEDDYKNYALSIYKIGDKWQVIQLNMNDSLVSQIPILAEVEMIDNQPIGRFKDICEYKSYLQEKAKEGASFEIQLKNQTEKIEVAYQNPKKGLLQ